MTEDRQNVLFEKSNGVARITFNRPERRNALSQELQADIASCLEEVREDSSISVVVTTGGDASAYCAGGELRAVVSRLESGTGPAAPSTPLDIHEMVRAFPKVTIAALNGYCLGGGLALALCHDIVIASEEKAVLGVPEVFLNLVPARPSAYLFRAMPHKWAFDMVLTGERWDARTAFQRGLVSRLVPHAQLQDAAYELAGSIAQLDKITLEYCKKSAHAIMDAPTLAAAIEIGSVLFKEHNRVNPLAGKGARHFLAGKKAGPQE